MAVWEASNAAAAADDDDSTKEAGGDADASLTTLLSRRPERRDAGSTRASEGKTLAAAGASV
jgi:hypothetical protein